MDDPFADLIKSRQSHEEQMHRARIEQEDARRRAEQALLERKRYRKSYDKLVIDVLEKLRKAAYPGLKGVNRFEEGTFQYGDVDWYIGRWNYDVDDGPVGIQGGVGVLLLFDENNKPSGFRCRHYDDIIETGLSRGELIETLRQLHS